MNWLKNNWLIIFILLISLFLRTYRIGETMTFLEDEGRDLLIAKRMIDTGRPVLLGPQTSTGNMYLGPLYYYFITPALYLSGMNPVGPAVLIALSGVLTTYLLYILGRKWFGNTSGYLAAVMFACLPFSVAVTRSSWNPNLVPLVSVLMLIVYDRIITNKQMKWSDWLFHGMLIGIMIQLHYMALIFCGVLSLSLAWNKRREFLTLLRGVAISFLGLFIMLLPFIVFEIRNDWVNTTALTRFMLAKEERNIRYDLPAWLWWDKVSKTSYRLIGNTLIGSEMGGQTQTPLVVSGLLILLVISSTLSFIKKESSYLRLIVLLIGSLAVVGIYQENIHMHYLEYGIPLIILAITGINGLKISQLISYSSIVFIILIIGLGSARSLGYIRSGATHQAEKAKLVSDYIVRQAGDKPYNVVSTQGMYTTPFQYFLAISSHRPSNKLESTIFDICAGSPCPEDDQTTTLLFLTGPGHPAISNYLGHPEINDFAGKRKIISNEHVSYGLWVAEIVLE